MKTYNRLMATGLFTALVASLCCITPALALLAGVSGVASAFSWLEPFRPYFTGLTFLLLGFAWYQKLKPEKTTDCNCRADDPKKFIHSKKFLGGVTVFVIVILAFPYYADVFYPQTEIPGNTVGKPHIRTVEFTIKGMTCAACEKHIYHELSKVHGITASQVSYEKGNAVVEFDAAKTTILEIEKAIAATGYAVTDKMEK